MNIKVKYLLTLCLAMPCLALGYAKISETMKCINKDCSGWNCSFWLCL